MPLCGGGGGSSRCCCCRGQGWRLPGHGGASKQSTVLRLEKWSTHKAARGKPLGSPATAAVRDFATTRHPRSSRSRGGGGRRRGSGGDGGGSSSGGGGGGSGGGRSARRRPASSDLLAVLAQHQTTPQGAQDIEHGVQHLQQPGAATMHSTREVRPTQRPSTGWEGGGWCVGVDKSAR